jgi:Rhodopirellula transposase DDE domain
VIDVIGIRLRWEQSEPFLDERGRRLFAASAAQREGPGGVTAVSRATGLARSTINRGIRELRSGRNEIGGRVRRPGAGRKSAVTHQPELPAALERLIEDAIRGDPCSPLRWISRSQRHLVKALAAQGLQVSQRVVANLLRELNYSCQANRKTREGGNHPDRDAQFAHINATVKAALAAGEPAISVDTKKKGVLQRHERSS